MHATIEKMKIKIISNTLIFPYFFPLSYLFLPQFNFFAVQNSTILCLSYELFCNKIDVLVH